MKRIEQLKQDYDRLQQVVNDCVNLSVAYPILARHLLMERTPNGYRATDPDVVMRRCRKLLDAIEGEILEDIGSA